MVDSCKGFCIFVQITDVFFLTEVQFKFIPHFLPTSESREGFVRMGN